MKLEKRGGAEEKTAWRINPISFFLCIQVTVMMPMSDVEVGKVKPFY